MVVSVALPDALVDVLVRFAQYKQTSKLMLVRHKDDVMQT